MSFLKTAHWGMIGSKVFPCLEAKPVTDLEAADDFCRQCHWAFLSQRSLWERPLEMEWNNLTERKRKKSPVASSLNCHFPFRWYEVIYHLAPFLFTVQSQLLNNVLGNENNVIFALWNSFWNTFEYTHLWSYYEYFKPY